MIDKMTKEVHLESLYFTSCLVHLATSPKVSQADLLTAIEAAMTLLEARNSKTTCGHSSEVAFVATFIADRLGLPPRERARIKLAALVHDIGKVIREEYPGQHALLGAQIMRSIPGMDEIADMVLFHHPPCQDAACTASQPGIPIPLGARIISVADAFQKCMAHCRDKEALMGNGFLEELCSQAESGLDLLIIGIVVENHEMLSRFVG